MQIIQYETHLNIEIWNEQKNYCGFANKRVKLPFQPVAGMIIKFHIGDVCFSHVAWDMTAKVFEASARIISGLHQDQYLDLNYYLDELRREDWNIIHARERKWQE